MNTKAAILELSTRFDSFEERFDRLGQDVSAIAALFYNHNASVDTFGWQPTHLPKCYPNDVESLVFANIGAWNKVLGVDSE